MLSRSYGTGVHVVQLGGTSGPVADWSGFIEKRLSPMQGHSVPHAFGVVLSETGQVELHSKNWSRDDMWISGRAGLPV